MTFQKGNKHSKGRPKGSTKDKNKLKAEVVKNIILNECIKRGDDKIRGIKSLKAKDLYQLGVTQIPKEDTIRHQLDMPIINILGFSKPEGKSLVLDAEYVVEGQEKAIVAPETPKGIDSSTEGAIPHRPEEGEGGLEQESLPICNKPSLEHLTPSKESKEWTEVKEEEKEDGYKNG